MKLKQKHMKERGLKDFIKITFQGGINEINGYRNPFKHISNKYIF